MQPRVLDQNRKLRAERAHQRNLVLVERVVALRVHGEEADDRLAREQRNGKQPVDPGFRELAANAREQVESLGRRHDQCLPAPEGAERESEQPLRDARMRADEAAAGDRLQPSPLEQVDGNALDRQELRDPLDRRFERVGQRELCDRLADDRHERPRALELRLRLDSRLAHAQRLRSAHAEGGEQSGASVQRLDPALEDELEDTERRLAEPDARDRPSDRDRSLALEHLGCDLLELGELRFLDGDLSGELERTTVAQAPQQGSRRSTGLDGELHEVSSAAACRQRERLARQLELPLPASSANRRCPPRARWRGRGSACAAADSANDLSSFLNGSAARTSSSSPTTSSPRSIGTQSADSAARSAPGRCREPMSSAESALEAAQTVRATRSPLPSSRTRTTAASACRAVPTASVRAWSASEGSRIASKYG